MKNLAALVDHPAADGGGVGYVAVVRRSAGQPRVNRLDGLRILRIVGAGGGVTRMSHRYVRVRHVFEVVRIENVADQPGVLAAFQPPVDERGDTRALLPAMLQSHERRGRVPYRLRRPRADDAEYAAFFVEFSHKQASSFT